MGEIRTATTGTGMTTTCAVAVFPSTLAATGTVPTYLPVTTPSSEIVAKLESALTQSTLRPVTGFPSASSAVAVNDAVVPTATVAVAGMTSTVATGWLLGSRASSPHAVPAAAVNAAATAHDHCVGSARLIVEPACVMNRRRMLHESNPRASRAAGRSRVPLIVGR